MRPVLITEQVVTELQAIEPRRDCCVGVVN